jgi:hypothetical protein
MCYSFTDPENLAIAECTFFFSVEFEVLLDHVDAGLEANRIHA